MWTSKWIASALGLATPPYRSFSQISTDSRKIKAGCLFVALSGENFDGHAFIPQAIENGAGGILCRKGTLKSALKALDAEFFFEVDDPLIAYRKLSAAWRREFQIPIVMVAGSVGKTTTKELFAAALRGKFKSVLKTEGSQNGFVGIPLTLMELRSSHDIAVIEVGIDEVGAMAQHLSLLAPTASIVSAIGPEHLEKLHDLQTIAYEENLALRFVSEQGGKIALNYDDPYVKPLLSELKTSDIVVFSLSEKAPPVAVRAIYGFLKDHQTLAITSTDGKKTSVTLPLLGEHNARNLLGAFALGLLHGLSLEEMKRGLSTFEGALGRSELKTLPKGTSVLCDYYNANPTSTEAALRLLAQLSRKNGKKRWACLGDMLELGPAELQYHRELAHVILETGLEHLYLYGPRMKALQDELQIRKYPGELKHFSEHGDIAKLLQEKATDGLILIKGSHGMKMEKIFQILSSS